VPLLSTTTSTCNEQWIEVGVIVVGVDPLLFLQVVHQGVCEWCGNCLVSCFHKPVCEDTADEQRFWHCTDKCYRNKH